MATAAGPEIERLISLLSKLPGLGPRSARRATLALLRRREQLLAPLARALAEADHVLPFEWRMTVGEPGSPPAAHTSPGPLPQTALRSVAAKS